jgi:hypothetical protein
MAVNERTHFDDLILNGPLLVLTFSTGLHFAEVQLIKAA